MKISTEVLKDLTSRVMKGVGNNQHLPITSLLGVALDDGVLSLSAYDGDNYTIVTSKVNDDSSFSVVVFADLFSKLVAKTTTKEITITMGERALAFKGNGNYKLECVMEGGELLIFPAPAFVGGELEGMVAPTALLKELYSTLKSSLYKDNNISYLMGYYVDDGAITSDINVCSFLKFGSRLAESPILLRAEMVALFNIFTGKEVTIYVDAFDICMTDGSTIISGTLLESVETYPVKALKAIYDYGYGGGGKVSRKALLEVLDRVCLFITNEEENTIQCEFKDGILNIVSLAGTGVEAVEVVDYKAKKDYTCRLNAKMVQEQLGAFATDFVNMKWDNEKAVYFNDANLTKVIPIAKPKAQPTTGKAGK